MPEQLHAIATAALSRHLNSFRDHLRGGCPAEEVGAGVLHRGGAGRWAGDVHTAARALGYPVVACPEDGCSDRDHVVLFTRELRARPPEGA